MKALESEDPQQVGGYRLLARLGAGGMGRVYLARSRGGRRVALKVIRAELADDPDFRARFAREVAAAKAVGGAFTVSVLDADAEAETPWLATEYVAGPSLSEAVREHGPLPVASVRALAAGLAEALVAIHRAGVVHRDLKPSNVLLAVDGPRVIDFGISRAMEATELTRTGVIVGSPGFMSPEQIEGDQVTPATDVFSLGAVLAYAATGAGPFGDGATPALLYRVVHNAPRLDALPAELRGLVGSCLVKEAALRPSPDALLDRLEAEEGEEAHDPTVMWLPSELTGMIAKVEAERPSALEPAAHTPAPSPAAAAAAPAGSTAETVPLPPVPTPTPTPTPEPATPPTGFGPAPAMAGFAAESRPTPPPGYATSPPTRTMPAAETRPPRRRAPLIVAMLLLIAAVSAGVVWATVNHRGPTGNQAVGGGVASSTSVPATATESASASASASATPTDSATATSGYTTAATVYLDVPDVTGQPVDYAKQLLTDKGFYASRIKVSYHCTQAGTGVYKQNPAAGSSVPQNSVIKLTAEEGDCVAYTSEVGLPLATAQADLKGFSNITVTKTCSAGGTAGYVVAQSPAVTPEASYPPSQPITLTVQSDTCGSASPSATP